MRSPDPSSSLLGDTSHYSTPMMESSEKMYTSLHLDEDQVNRALGKWQQSQQNTRPLGASGWWAVRKGRLHVSRKALLVVLLGVVTVVAVGSRVSSSERGHAWRAPWAAAPAASGQDDTAAGPLDPSKPLKIHKYAGGRQGLSTVHPAFPLLEVLNHATAQPTLKSQLRAGVRYITTMAFGGHANQFISIQKMLYMAKSTSRVAVIPSLIPIHIDGLATAMSTFYDIHRFNAEAGVPAVEMVDLKAIDLESSRPHNERVSCWSTQELAIGFPNGQAWSFDVHDIWVDHWALPPMARGMGGQDVAFDALRMFDFNGWERNAWVDKARREFLPQEPQREGQPVKSGKENQKPGFPTDSEQPSDQFLCYDNTLFIGPVMFDPAYPGSIPMEDPAPGEDTSWKEVGQHLHFNRELESLADQYLVDLFDCGDASKIPPFLSIHLRRGDFKEFTGFTDLDRYISGLTRLRTRLQKRLDDPFAQRGVFLNHFRHFGIKADEYAVVVTTDEQPGTEFWREVEKMGWRIIDHDRMKTKETLGPWHMTMVDAAVLARGQGFVGTQSSTFSHLAGLRVKYWNGGLVDGAW